MSCVLCFYLSKKTYSRMQNRTHHFVSVVIDLELQIKQNSSSEKKLKKRTFLIRQKKSNRFPCQNCKSCCKSEGAHTAHTYADILNLNNKISLNVFQLISVFLFYIFKSRTLQKCRNWCYLDVLFCSSSQF